MRAQLPAPRKAKSKKNYSPSQNRLFILPSRKNRPAKLNPIRENLRPSQKPRRPSRLSSSLSARRASPRLPARRKKMSRQPNSSIRKAPNFLVITKNSTKSSKNRKNVNIFKYWSNFLLLSGNVNSGTKISDKPLKTVAEPVQKKLKKKSIFSPENSSESDTASPPSKSNPQKSTNNPGKGSKPPPPRSKPAEPKARAPANNRPSEYNFSKKRLQSC